MKKLLWLATCLFAPASCLWCQNVGIGTATPQDRLEVSGRIRSTGLRIAANNSIDLGFGTPDKEQNAGRMGYALFTPNTLDIVGAGSQTDNRRIRLWAEDVTEFTGKGHFFGITGIGTPPVTGTMLAISGGNGVHLSLRHTAALSNGLTTTLAMGGSNYTTGLVQTIGTGTGAARMAFSTGYSFSGGVSNMAERLSITNEGRVGIGRTAPTAQLEIGSTNSSDWLRIVSENVEVLKVNTAGLKFNATKSSYEGAALVNSSQDGLAKWGYMVQGAQMEKNSDQAIAHGVSTKIWFTQVIFDHNNAVAFDDNNIQVANLGTSEFKMMHRGIALIDYEITWANSPGGLGGGGLRNGRVQIVRNGTIVRTILDNSNMQINHVYLSVNEGDIITINAYHEHCVDPPPICVTGIARTVSGARVSVINL